MVKVQLYVNKDRFNELSGNRYKRRNAKIIKEGCLWFLTPKDLLKCPGWDSVALETIKQLKNTLHCFNFKSNQDFTGWLFGNFA